MSSDKDYDSNHNHGALLCQKEFLLRGMVQ